MKTKKHDPTWMVSVALFAALIVVLTYTPIGYIPLGIINARLTTIHIPVILGSVLLGPKKGAVLGGVFGLTSFLTNTFQNTASLTAFMFTPFAVITPFQAGDIRSLWSLVICFLPRILVGILPYYAYKGIQRVVKNKKIGQTFALAISGAVGSLTNTILVMSLTILFYKDAYESARNIQISTFYGYITAMVGINGVLEAIVAVVIVMSVGRALLKTRIVQSV